MPGGALEAETLPIKRQKRRWEMHPWIAEQANREHIAELRSLGRPFRVSPAGWGLGRLWGTQAESKRAGPVVGRKRRISVRF